MPWQTTLQLQNFYSMHYILANSQCFVFSASRISPQCCDWGTFPFHQHVDGSELIFSSCFHHAHFCKFLKVDNHKECFYFKYKKRLHSRQTLEFRANHFLILAYCNSQPSFSFSLSLLSLPLTHSLTHSLTLSVTLSFTHSLTHSLTLSLTLSFTHSLSPASLLLPLHRLSLCPRCWDILITRFLSSSVRSSFCLAILCMTILVRAKLEVGNTVWFAVWYVAVCNFLFKFTYLWRL